MVAKRNPRLKGEKKIFKRREEVREVKEVKNKNRVMKNDINRTRRNLAPSLYKKPGASLH
jgi:hypothetical protein